MPPFTGWYQGAEAIAALIRTNCPARRPGDMRLVPTQANGQPAFAHVPAATRDCYRPFGLPVLTFTGALVSHVSMFFDLSLFDFFGLPRTLERASASK